MRRHEIEASVRTFIVDNYLYREGVESVAGSDSFLALGLIDSMGILELIAFLEETFGIRMADEEMIPENLDSIERVTAYVARKTHDRASRAS
jgi:acyl carrier protein